MSSAAFGFPITSEGSLATGSCGCISHSSEARDACWPLAVRIRTTPVYRLRFEAEFRLASRGNFLDDLVATVVQIRTLSAMCGVINTFGIVHSG